MALLFFHAFGAPAGFVIFYIYKKPIIHHKGLMYVCMAFWECKSTICEYFMLSIFLLSFTLDPVTPVWNKKKPSTEWFKLFSNRGPFFFVCWEIYFLNSLVCNYLHLHLSQIIITVDIATLHSHLPTASAHSDLRISAATVQIENCPGSKWVPV